MSGSLLIVGTPLGNLDDFPPRAVAALQRAALILCEDTRHTRKLLQHFGITTPAESFHEHNEDAKADRLIARIRAGDVLALVSDAGMPVVSDPGFAIVRRAREQGLTIEPIPGPFAGVLALVSSGIAPLPFAFFGFAPHRAGERRDFYREIRTHAMTSIVYESPERVLGSLANALEVLGDVEVTVAREMTKMHEEFISASVSEVLEILSQRDSIRGEITLVFGASKDEIAVPDLQAIGAEFNRLREGGMRRNDAVKAIAEKFGLRKNDVYKMLVEQ